MMQLWAGVLLVKIIILPFLPITPDEAYYFAWSRHLDLSYFDHPPFISWIMLLAQPLWKTPFGIRMPGVLIGHLAYLPWIALLQRFNFTILQQRLWFLALVFGPLTGIGAFIITPDVPLLFFWGMGILALVWAIENPDDSYNWILLGACIGFGMLSKYIMVLFILCALMWAVSINQTRLLKTSGPWLSALVALLLFSIVILWNYENSWSSFMFQAKHGLKGASLISFKFPLEYIGAQAGLLNPFLFLLMIFALVKNRFRTQLFMIFGFVPLMFFFLTSFRARVEANWPVCGYPALMAIAVSAVTGERIITFKKYCAQAIGVSVVFIVVVMSHATKPWIPINPQKDHTKITREWRADVEAAKKFTPLFARSYQMAAFHSYYREPEDEVFKLAGSDRRDFYDFISESNPKQKSYVIFDANEKLPEIYTGRFVLKNPLELPSKHVLYELTPL